MQTLILFTWATKKGNIKLNVLLALTRYCSFFFKSTDFIKNIQLYVKAGFPHFNSAWKPRTTNTQWKHKSKISEKLGWCGRQNMLRPYLKTWEWEWIFGRAVKAISALDVRSPWWKPIQMSKAYFLLGKPLKSGLVFMHKYDEGWTLILKLIYL